MYFTVNIEHSRLPSISLSLHVIKIILDHTQRGRFVVQVISQI